MAVTEIGNTDLHVEAGELVLFDGKKQIKIPFHSVKSMLGLYKFKSIMDKEIRSFKPGVQGWIEFADVITGIYNDRYGNKKVLTNIKELAMELGIKQVDINRGFLIAAGEDFETEKWVVAKKPPLLAYNIERFVPIHKTLENEKIKTSPILQNFFKTNLVVKKSLDGRTFSFKEDAISQPALQGM